MVSQAAMRGQRVVESVCRCWNPAVLLLVSLLGSLILVAVSLLLRHGDVKINKRDAYTNDVQTPVRTQYQVRLVNGHSRCEGRVEVLYNGSWGTVCDDDWDMVDANVVCRQLNCGVAVAVGSSARFGKGTGLILLDNVDCRGSETELGQCRALGWGVHNCYHYEDVAVTCKGPAETGSEIRTTPPQENSRLRDGTIRLVNGHNACQGRVEIFYQGRWGTVCDDEWDLKNAHVVCQQIGCGSAVQAPTNSYFGHGSGRILLDNVHCYGHEQQLDRCYSLGWGKHNCGHHEDAGVVCTGATTEPPPIATEGQKELSTTYITEATEQVPVTEAQTTTTVTTTVQTKGRPAVRVMNGNNSCEGRVEVFYKNVWGTVCDDDWNMPNANVVCRQIGCGHAIAIKITAHFGYGSGPILLDNVACEGSEHELTECFHLGWGQHNCGHHEDAGVVCAPISYDDYIYRGNGRDFRVTERIPAPTTITTQPPEGAMRLVGGQNRCEGRVEMYSNSSWGTVCDDAWDLPDAQVVCRQVGCGEATQALEKAHFGPGTGTILLDNLKCEGGEASLLKCSHISQDAHNCDHFEDAGVTCSLS